MSFTFFEYEQPIRGFDISHKDGWTVCAGKEGTQVLYRDSDMEGEEFQDYLDEGYSLCYCRGYFIPMRNACSYHILILDDGGKVHEIEEDCFDRAYVETHSYGSQILSVRRALDWGIKNNKKKLVIVNAEKNIPRIATQYQGLGLPISTSFNEFFNNIYTNFSNIRFETTTFTRKEVFPYLRDFLMENYQKAEKEGS